MTDWVGALTSEFIGRRHARLEGVGDVLAAQVRPADAVRLITAGVGRWRATPRPTPEGKPSMSKRGRKRRSRAGSASNHGKRPNA
ncbi:hypothetical protein CPE01_02830 [Cellulomonas persica]|uniref:Uncharacterized protein n=1 Tax=Cellulomonas persica TaxID=76861 RepID=A0A510UTM1_9CELL|nr:hypothetical protein CPE01_02830 [Cellulomonas persica]